MAFLNHSTKTPSKNLILCEVLQGRHRGKKKERERNPNEKKKSNFNIFFFCKRMEDFKITTREGYKIAFTSWSIFCVQFPHASL